MWTAALGCAVAEGHLCVAQAYHQYCREHHGVGQRRLSAGVLVPAVLLPWVLGIWLAAWLP